MDSFYYYTTDRWVDARGSRRFCERKGGVTMQQAHPAPSGTEEKATSAWRELLSRLKNGSFGEVLADWKWIWRFSRRRRGAIALYTLCGLMTSGMGLISGVAGKYLIDSIVALDASRLLEIVGLVLCSTALSLGCRSLTSRLSARLSVDMQNDIREHAFDALLQTEWLALGKYPTGDLLNRFSGDISTVSGCAVSWLPNAIIQVFTLLTTLGVILYYDPVMALIGCISTPFLLLLSRRPLRRQRHFNRRMREVSSDLSSFQSETFRNMDTLKAFGVEDHAGEELREHQREYRQVTMDYNWFRIKTDICLSVAGTAVQYLAFAYCLWRLWRGDILFGTMVLFLQQRSTLSSALSGLMALVPTALSGSVAAERVRELTELPKEEQHAAPGQPVPTRGWVRLSHVRVTYDDDRRILSGVELEAGPGETVALVGPSGEGKTTLMRLLLGLIRPEKGEMYLETEEGERLPLGAATRRCFAYVPQGNTLIAGTVRENLRLACREATEEELCRALEDACAWDFVNRLPRGLDSPVGEGGGGLSEGQAQRIAIARALLRRAPVMLLDEVTSALDRETEQRVLRNLMGRGVTCIVVTHRTAVLPLCTRVYRVSEGAVERLDDTAVQRLLEE